MKLGIIFHMFCSRKCSSQPKRRDSRNLEIYDAHKAAQAELKATQARCSFAGLAKRFGVTRQRIEQICSVESQAEWRRKRRAAEELRGKK